MGRPKLLLTFGGQTVIERLLAAVNHPRIVDRLVVVRPGDAALEAAVARAGGTVVRPESDPPDMRASVQHALHAIRDRYHPADTDAWLLLPADHPQIRPAVLDALFQNALSGQQILVPTFGGRRGHPVLFPWSLADEVAAIPSDRGIDWLLERHKVDVTEVAVADEGILLDLDTPADWAALRERADSLDDPEHKIEDRLSP